MGAQPLVVSGENYSARVAFHEGDREIGGILIQPPVKFSSTALNEEIDWDASGVPKIRVSETASGENGTFLQFGLQPSAFEDIDYSNLPALDERAVEVVTKAASVLVALADATSNSKLFDKFFSTGEVAVTDGN